MPIFYSKFSLLETYPQKQKEQRQKQLGADKLIITTFDLYPWGEGHGVQGQICDILRPQLAMNPFLPLWPRRFQHFVYIHLGGGGVGALILDRCRAFDLFASVDAHLWKFRSLKIWCLLFLMSFPFLYILNSFCNIYLKRIWRMCQRGNCPVSNLKI